MKDSAELNRYAAIIEKIFLDRYSSEITAFEFARQDLEEAATSLGLEMPSNIGDVLYSFRYRSEFPRSILDTQPADMEWIIEGAGRSRYEFKLVRLNRILPNEALTHIKIPDSTPEIISAYALSDEQALLAKVRYNRLIDIFLGISCYSLQNHLRTTVKDIGQIEIDEIYVGIDRHGRQYILPVQAKGGSDRMSVVQAKQDIRYCEAKFPHLICKAISTQFMSEDLIAIFELTIEDDEIRIVEERHYVLVPSDKIDASDLSNYNRKPL